MGTKVKKRFTDDFKKDAVNLVVKQGYSNTEAAKSLGISESAIRTWIKKFGPNRVLSVTLFRKIPLCFGVIMPAVKLLFR